MKTKLSIAFLLISSIIYGQDVPVAVPTQKGFTLDTNTLLIIFAVFLLWPIWTLSNTFIAAARHYYTEKLKSGSAKVLIPLGFLLMSTSLLAQGTKSSSPLGLSYNGMTILLLCTIGVELLFVLFFAQKTNEFIRKIKARDTELQPERNLLIRLKEKWAAMNFKPIEEEHKIDTGHSYDGIRELDNVIPPWFTTAFAITILFGIGYLYRYHIAKSAPMQLQEYKNAVALAEIQHEEYLKTQASNIDETNVGLMTGADLEAGKKTFLTLCAVCHKSDGGGMVGPNLTDEYWLHGGAIKDIFKTIKYGYPDKGMISWKEQLSPVQIAQVANYIHTLKGTNPPDAKEKQGTLYVPEVTGSDTLSGSPMKTDTLPVK